jgi:DNA-binding MarR family transcriptional regulator
MDDTSISPEADFDSIVLARLFHHASKMMARSYHRHSHAHHAQAHVYTIIRERGPLSQKDLLNTLDVRSSSLSEVLNKLEQRGLIVRKRDENDKRRFIVSANHDAERRFGAHGKACLDGVEIFETLDDEEKDRKSVV